MERLPPTRMALLQTRERRAVAARGAALLRSKRAAKRAGRNRVEVDGEENLSGAA